MGIEDIFSQENMLSYSKTCLDLAIALPEELHLREADTLVLPSRGAVPIFLGFLHGLKKLTVFERTHRDFYENMGVQGMIAPLLQDRSLAEKDLRKA